MKIIEVGKPKLQLSPIMLAIIAMKLGVIYTYNAAS